MDQPQLLSDKNGTKFMKLNDNHYRVSFDVENPHMNLPELINVDLFTLIYTLNPDIYESIRVEKMDDDEAYAIGILKHFFEDLGMPQRYSYLHIRRMHTDTNKPNVIRFNARTIYDKRPEGVSQELEIVSFDKMMSAVEIVSSHHLRIVQDIYVNEKVHISPMIEKFIGTIIMKICKRIKLFIESAV
jgi:hypothetical protein